MPPKAKARPVHLSPRPMPPTAKASLARVARRSAPYPRERQHRLRQFERRELCARENLVDLLLQHPEVNDAEMTVLERRALHWRVSLACVELAEAIQDLLRVQEESDIVA